MSENVAVAEKPLEILLIDDDLDRASAFRSALDRSRYRLSHLVSSRTSLLKEVDKLKPDIIVIDIESPDRDILESLSTLSNFNPKPVVMFCEQEDTGLINQSVQSGVSAYVVGEVSSARVRSILDAAVARFNQYQSLKQELSETKRKLDSRRLVDKAKSLLMQKKAMSEEQAFNSIRKMAMDTGQRMEDVARTLITLISTLDN
ncbi:ANTAR domain-containing response regulator [Bowmanella dokdonensis]|uniref:ANTAR domain-containing protein n=1 Tax=Bowmanella dokdonensis TaxID=751969 RepID=A0A939DSU5_9ALTE|nr:ANTAR domain-containing protein [Bowmanella dokdonensis]MBN7827276.1 ANTAR domain-containing protein [Bowmanella dokdonensis]